MNKLTEWLVKPFINEVELPIKVGDVVLMGRFKNKRVKVKSITYNEKGDLQINGRPALKFRIQKSDKKLLPTKTTNKSSAEPDSDRKGVDDEYPHYKLKESPAKFQSVHLKSTFDSLFGSWYSNHVPLTTKLMQGILGKERVSVFHVGSAYASKDIANVGRIVGKKSALSTFSSVDKGEKLAKGKGIQTQGGVIYQLEGSLLVASTRDMQTHPDKTGRRWVSPTYLAGKGAGSKMFNELKKFVETNKRTRRDFDFTMGEFDTEISNQNDDLDYSDPKRIGFEERRAIVKKEGNRIKREWIVKYINFCMKMMKKYAPQIKRHILSQKDKPAEHGWNEIIVNQIKVKDVFVLSRENYPSNIKELEKFATGKITVGSPAQFRKWFNERGGLINESFFGLGAGDVPSPSRKGVEKMKKKGNTSVPYGSGYKKIDERATNAYSQGKLHKNITGFNLTYKGRKYKEIDFEVKKIDNKKDMVTLRILNPKKLFGKDLPVAFKTIRRGPFMKTDTSKKVNEQEEVKKVVAIYPGRFQPFGPHHKKVFEALKGKFDEVYIATSNIQGMPRHPLNFNEKKKHMIKMGIPGKNIIQEKNPYKADILRKFGDDTAAVYVVGKKDAGRLSSGKYFKDFKFAVKRKDLVGYEDNGYVYSAPHQKVSGISSGTEIRNLLGSPKVDEKKRQQIFKKTFGYFDKSTYEMMTSRFGKLFEFVQQPEVKKIIKEVSGFGSHFDASVMSDEGMYDFFGSLDDYFRVSPEHAKILGWEVIGFPIKDSMDMRFTIEADDYEQDRAKTVTYGKTINQNRKNTDSVDNPFPKYKELMIKNLSNLNWEIVKFFGEKSVDMKDSTTITKQDVKKGITHIKSIQESFQQDVDLWVEAMCGVGQNPADTGCTPKGSSKTKVKKKPFEIPKIQLPKFNIPKFKLDPEKMKKVAAKRKKRKEKALVRPDRKPNMKDGVDIIRDKKDTQHFIDDFLFKADKGVDLNKLTKEMDNQYQEQKKKLSKKEQKQLVTDIESWKKYGGFEAIRNAIEDGDTTEQEIRERNERMSDLAHKTTNNIDKAIERGIQVPNDVANAILSEFKIGEMVEIPDEKGHGSSGFSLSGETAREFSRVDGDGDETSILFRIEPNSKGQIRGLYIDGDESSTISREREITRSSKSKAKVMSVETKKLPNGKEVKIVTLQEPDDLTETIVRESDKKFSELSRKYLEGPLNPKPRKKKLQKEHLILEGGAYGHMNHPFDDNNLLFSDLKNIVIIGLEGKLNREDKVSEKLDGQNLMISWVNGKLKAARNNGHIKNRGASALDAKGMASKFAGRGQIKKAFYGAMVDLEKAIGSLSNAQQEKVFGNGTKWMNLEVIYPQTANIIDYDVAEIVFHGALEYNESGKPIGQAKDSARMLQGMIKQVNQNIQKTFRISRPNFLTIPKSQNFGKLKSQFLGQLNKLQKRYNLKDSDRLGMYHESFWKEYVFNAAKQFKVNLKSDQFIKLVNRWAYFDKTYKIPQIRKDFKSKPQFLNWILDTDKKNHMSIWKENIKPFEILFFKVGAEILKNIQGFLAVSPDKATQKIRQDVISAMNDLRKSGNIEKLQKLKIQIEKLEAIGGLNAIVPSEGLVFKYKGNLYKFTGAFAPINQILGSLKF